MRLKLNKATKAEQEAAFKVVQKRAVQIINDWVPWLFQSKALDELNSPEGKATVLSVIDEALDAAEAAKEQSN